MQPRRNSSSRSPQNVQHQTFSLRFFSVNVHLDTQKAVLATAVFSDHQRK